MDPLLAGPLRVWVPAERLDAAKAALAARDAETARDIQLLQAKATQEGRASGGVVLGTSEEVVA